MIVAKREGSLVLENARPHRYRVSQAPNPGAWEDDLYVLPATLANIEWLESEFSAASWRPEAQLLLSEIVQRRTTEHLVAMRAAESRDLAGYEFKTKPYDHQLEGFLRSRDERYYGLLMDMGTGKTKLLIDTMAWLWLKGRISAAIVFAPNSVHRQFVVEQLPVHMPDVVPWEGCVYRSGATGARAKALTDFLKPSEKFRVLAVNVEAMSSPGAVEYVNRFLKSVPVAPAEDAAPVLCAVDESTRIKSPSAKRTRSVTAIGLRCRYRRILSGSPVTKGIEDLYSQLKFLSPVVLGFANYYSFRSHFCVLKNVKTAGNRQTFAKIVGYQKVEELQQKLRRWTYRVRKEDCLDLPPKVYVTRSVPLSKQQREVYVKLRDDLLAELSHLDGSTSLVTAMHAASLLLRLQQVTCGFAKADTGTIVFEDVPRIDEVVAIGEEVEGQIVVWARFRADIDRLQRVLDPLGGAARYDGTLNVEDRAAQLNAFRAGQKRWFIGQPAAGGIGLNLVGPQTVIYYSNSFDAELRWQSEDRCHRIGATKSVTYVDLVSPGTVDGHILRNLRNKRDVASLTVDDVKLMLRHPDADDGGAEVLQAQAVSDALATFRSPAKE